MALCALLPIVAAGTLNLMEIADMQTGGSLGGVLKVQHWFIFHDPFMFVGFFVYFTVATASCKRAPFDLAEAESELVGGFHTEYSGMRWSFFFLGEYASMFAVSGIAAILFLGGWHTGLAPLDDWLIAERAAGAVSDGFLWSSYFANLIGLIVFVKKASLLVFVQIWLRWTLPRLRIDQVMMTCLKYLIPISCVLLLGVVVWPFAVSSATGRSTLTTSAAFASDDIDVDKSASPPSDAGDETGDTSVGEGVSEPVEGPTEAFGGTAGLGDAPSATGSTLVVEGGR